MQTQEGAWLLFALGPPPEATNTGPGFNLNWGVRGRR